MCEVWGLFFAEFKRTVLSAMFGIKSRDRGGQANPPLFTFLLKSSLFAIRRRRGVVAERKITQDSDEPALGTVIGRRCFPFGHEGKREGGLRSVCRGLGCSGGRMDRVPQKESVRSALNKHDCYGLIVIREKFIHPTPSTSRPLVEMSFPLL